MGKKGPNTWVTPAEFKDRTALTFSSRSAGTLKLDLAYAAYYGSQSEYKQKQLYKVLQEYLVAHGGYWNQVERNKASGGLLEWMYNETAPSSVRMTTRRAAELDHAARNLVADTEIPYSRFGVLYFLGNIDLEMDMVSVIIEGVGAVGGAVGAGLSTNYGQLNDVAKSSHTAFKAAGMDVKASSVSAAGQGVLMIPQMATQTAGTVARTPVPPPPSPSWFPCTEAALRVATDGIPDVYSHNRFFGVAAGVGAAVVAVPVLAATLAADAGLALKRLGEALYAKIKGAIQSVIDLLKSKWNDGSTWISDKVGMAIKGVTKFVLDLVLKQAVPFIGGAIDIGTGIVRAVDDAITRISSYLDRKKIRLVPGHPEETANTIEHAMSMGIFKGIADVLKGAAKTAVAMTLPGLGSLVAALMSGIEWIIKFIYRLVEKYRIQEFLLDARKHWKEQNARAEVRVGEVGDRAKQIHPKIDGTGILCDTELFTLFFRKGCDASPIIPMLTLNSGLCGSIMTLVKLFDDDTGAQSHKAGAARQEFDVAGDYFKRLKNFSVGYLQGAGFHFKPLVADDEVMRGYLGHAVGAPRTLVDKQGGERKITTHAEVVTAGRKVVAALRA